MSATLLANELTNLASEAKRKNHELRNAAEKSLQELKGLPATSEQQLAADLSRRPTFIEPFIIACGTHNAKFAGSGVACLQRLVISRGLPKARLGDALQAFNTCTDLGLDIQLKILQALPSLLQNYADDLRGDLLSGALQVCSSLQGAKVQTVSGVAAATLQQLVTSVFEKVANEDPHAGSLAPHEVAGDDGPIRLRAAAFDAYRVFRDLAMAAEDRRTKFVLFTSMSQESSLELIWSCINANSELFNSHPELRSIIRANVLPFATRALTEKLTFQVTLRSLRILNLVILRYFRQFPEEFEVAFGLATQTLDSDAAPVWKRALVMEMLRGFFAEGSHVIDAYWSHDMTDGGKPIIQDAMSAFVRLSAEKPSVIGLGQQSTAPTGPAVSRDSASEQATIDVAGSMAGIISSALGVTEANIPGISSHWSMPRTPVLDQLDKSDAPTVPETYVYALVLDCLNSLSDSLAKVVLPLTVRHERPKTADHHEQSETNGQLRDGRSNARRSRSQSFRKRAVPLRPLEQTEHPVPTRARAVNDLVESCWPAVLAISSTFLNASLDDQYYRNLIKAYQRFTQVAGLLRLTTARDALMTTLGKAAVPAHILIAATAEPLKSPTSESPRLFSNPKGLLSVDSLVSQASTLSMDQRRGSIEPSKPMLTTRNLLCLRALLNLAIALGPTLETAFAVVVDTLRQADTILSSTTPQQMVRQGLTTAQKDSDSPGVVQVFTNEVTAVEAAASRLLESTAEYPNDAFLNVLNTFCRLLHGNSPSATSSPRPDQSSPPPTPSLKSRTFSGLTGFSSFAGLQSRNVKFVVPKLRSIAELNVSRFAVEEPDESGWSVLTGELITLASDNITLKEARQAATGVLCNVVAETIAEIMEDEPEARSIIQRRSLAVLLRLVDGIYAADGELTSTDIDVEGSVVDALRAILERSGESLVAGWNRVIAIISSVFERDSTSSRQADDGEAHIDWTHVSRDLMSVQLGRTAFAATQLICSDFLSALSPPVVPSLIELLYRFAKQDDDLNVSLTTITMSWNVSDFLLGRIQDDDLDGLSHDVKDADDFEGTVEATARTSTPAQWLLLLLRLQDAVVTSHNEVRKASFSTLCSIFKNHGDQLTPSAWDLTLRSILLRIAFSDCALHRSDAASTTNGKKLAHPDDSISSTIISGISDVLSQHLQSIERVASLPGLWEGFLSRLEGYLDLQKHSLTAVVYQALTKVLSRVHADTKTWSAPMYRTLHLWLKRNPATDELQGNESNQETLIAYVAAGAELYRLTQQSMSVSHTRTMIDNLYLCIKHSDGPRYGADMNSLSPLQGRVLDFLKTMRPQDPSMLVFIASKLVTLHHDSSDETPSNDRPTFVAMSSEAMDWLQSLVLAAVASADLSDSGVFVGVIESLRHVIEEKYMYRLEHKGVTLWRKATLAAVTLATPLLKQFQNAEADRTAYENMCREYAKITSGIVKAKGLEDVADETKVYEDQLADIDSFRSLRGVIIPRLGAPDLPDIVRLDYTRSLFEASMIHPTERGEIPDLELSLLKDVGKIRRGRVKRVPYSQREKMAYECFSELVKLSSNSEGSDGSVKLAQAAAPLLILRLAIPIRAYIADQPLRGRRPQPLSQLEELLFCFETIKTLELEPQALAANPESADIRGERAHLRFLYPLLAKAVGTAGDTWSGAEEVLAPLHHLLETIAPVF